MSGTSSVIEQETQGGGTSPASSASSRFELQIPHANLTERVRAAAPSPIRCFGSDPRYREFFSAFSRALHRREPQHVLIVRERGVGEQTVLVEMARRGVCGDPPFLAQREFVNVDLRHVPVEAFAAVIGALFAQTRGNENVVLCVDGIARLLRHTAGCDARGELLSNLARCECRVVGFLAEHECEELLSIDSEPRELFTVLRLHEPDPRLATELVEHFARGLEVQYGLAISPRAVAAAVALSSNYILNERLPYKAVKILRDCCDELHYQNTQESQERRQVEEGDVLERVAQVTNLPAETLAGVGERIDYLKSLGELIVGQEHAVREVATQLSLINAGLVDRGKPASVMMFIGQTGTGKTEMAKALARFYSSSKRLKTFTLGNFCEPHSVSGIIGVPPGYVGHDNGGRLVNELNADPYGVFLLDEADKAHPDVLQPFLNLFDEGWVYDQRGVKAYADRAIFVLTTNVGQRQIAEMCKSGKSIEEITSTMKESLSRIRHSKSNRPVFTPEFLARITRFVVFRSLDEQAMRAIAQKLIAQLQTDWQSKRFKRLEIPDALTERIGRAAAGLDHKSQGKEGGRIVRKLISDVIESRVQAAINESPQAYRECEVVAIEADEVDEVGDGSGDSSNMKFDDLRVVMRGSAARTQVDEVLVG